MKVSLGLVGAGRMGANMARRLDQQGFPVRAIYDTNLRAAQELAAELNCAAVGELAEVTRLSEIILTVVPDDTAMRAIFLPEALLREATGKLFINCATVTPSLHQEIEQLASQAGAASLEACMASSITQAREGTLF
jgi:3-hydroxyisobutyrate dehydrogenase